MDNQCVLVVDDEQRMRKLIKDFLVAKYLKKNNQKLVLLY